MATRGEQHERLWSVCHVTLRLPFPSLPVPSEYSCATRSSPSSFLLPTVWIFALSTASAVDTTTTTRIRLPLEGGRTVGRSGGRADRRGIFTAKTAFHACPSVRPSARRCSRLSQMDAGHATSTHCHRGPHRKVGRERGKTIDKSEKTELNGHKGVNILQSFNKSGYINIGAAQITSV